MLICALQITHVYTTFKLNHPKRPGEGIGLGHGTQNAYKNCNDMDTIVSKEKGRPRTTWKRIENDTVLEEIKCGDIRWESAARFAQHRVI